MGRKRSDKTDNNHPQEHKPLELHMNDSIDYDVVIVGAGPVGGYLATKFREKKVSVLILEEHSEIGRPFQCAGLVNPSAMEKVGLYDTVLTRIWGARMHSPSGLSIEIGQPNRVRTWSVCRKLFDEAVVREALESGAEISLSSKPINAVRHEDYVEVDISTPLGKKTITCALLCGADGSHSWVRRKFRMGRPKEMMIGFQIEVTGYPGVEGKLDVYTGEDIAPGFFAWAIPSGDTTRIGTWTRPDRLGERNCEELLNTLLQKEIWKERFNECKEIGRYCGPIPSGLISKPLIERVAVFGDAAGLCKPTTGGGIGKGFEQVDLLVPYLSEAIKNDKLSENDMKKMVKLLIPMKKKLNRSKALRDAFLTEATDDELDDVFSIWSRPEIIELINEKGDIENPIPLGIQMLRDVPEFRRLTKKAAAAIILG